MHRLLPPFLLGVALTAFACGNGTGTSVTGQDTATAPSEAELCTLEMWKASPEQAIKLLGKPAEDNGSSDWRSLAWFYDRGGRINEIALFLKFQDDVLVVPSVQNMPFPQCWKTDGGR